LQPLPGRNYPGLYSFYEGKRESGKAGKNYGGLPVNEAFVTMEEIYC
jgi:hypothetical protein